MLASDMNCLSVIVVEDFYRFARPRSTDRQRLRAGKIVVVLSGIAAATVAMRLAHTQGSALSLYYTITAIVAGGLAGLFLLAFLMPPSHARRRDRRPHRQSHLHSLGHLHAKAAKSSTSATGTSRGTITPSAPSATSFCWSSAS